MIYPKDFENKIGFDALRHRVASLCGCDMARVEVENISFLTDIEKIRHQLGCVEEMCGILRAEVELPLDKVYDVVPYITEIKARSSFMSADRLLKLMYMLETVDRIGRFFNRNAEGDQPLYPLLKLEFEGLMSFPEVIREISRCINKFGEVKDGASPQLAEIRQKIREHTGSMQRAMKRVLEKAIGEGIVERDVTPAVRDGRLVIPVSAAHKRSLNGIVHDESASGRTYFIEPAEVVAAGNKLRELEMEERREVTMVLMGLADLLRPYSEEIIKSCKSVGHLDFLRAKGVFANDINASMPKISKKIEIEWYHAVHPGLELSLRQHGRKVVPLNITLNSDQRILIISGPNAGGKSVCLKTVAVVQYMMQCGFLPSLYSNSHMGVFESIFIDIGDEQSFENDLSTYSSHLKNMKYFLSHADKSTLLLADELGSGTEPQIGGAMAQSILSFLGKSGCLGVITTHYQNLKTFADSEDGFVNGAMLYDRQHLQPTFELSIGSPGSSFALDIASKVGLPRDVIARAKEIAGSDAVNIDRYLSEITRDRRYWANKRQSIKEKESKLTSLVEEYESSVDSLSSQRNEILRDAKKEAKEILQGVNAKIERTILDIRNVQAEKEKTKEIRKQLEEYRKDLEQQSESDALPGIKKVSKHNRRKVAKASTSSVAKNQSSLAVNDYVKMDGGGVAGKILSIQGNKAEVAFGALRTTIALDKLKPASKPKDTIATQVSTVSRQTEEDSRRRQLNFSTELDVRGMRGDEAIQALNYFMDDVVQFNASRVRILHGTGHGILKTLLRQQLDVNPNVVSYHDEDVRFGGAGITVVEL